MKDEMTIKGDVFLTVKNAKTNEIIDKMQMRNMIMDNAIVQILHSIADVDVNKCVNQISFGTSDVAVTANDENLQEAFDKELTSATINEALQQIDFNFSLLAQENNGKILKEIGLKWNDGTLFARRVLTRNIDKNENVALEGLWSISLTKTVEENTNIQQ